MLQINYIKGKYELEGNLVLENSRSLKSYLETLLNYNSKVILSLRNIKAIDNSSIEVLFELCKKASQNNKVLKVFGKANKNITKTLNNSKLKEFIKN
ncbi:STAS domain-containing protein [Tenacibaculum sp. nBUS_03]|uniref:STAS domain-containing protein n=1 Tax=Tenacibaculum sp. nBUS_03 TaxID=3395320 RepID=UPI003EBAF9FC